jgi:hypothetical protein
LPFMLRCPTSYETIPHTNFLDIHRKLLPGAVL